MGRFTKKFLSIMLALSLMGGGAVFASSEVDPDEPSAWAERDLRMAYTFKVVEPVELSDFRNQIDADTFSSVIESLKTQLGIEADTVFENTKLTRLDVVNTMYDITKEAYKVEDRADISDNMIKTPLVYFLSKGIISGDENGFSLDKICTREEFFVIVERTYENIQRELGNSTSGLMWEVSDGDNKVYLFGSIHIGNEKLYPLSREIMNAYKESENLVVEVDITQTNDIAAYLKTIMFIEGDTTVDQLLDESTYNVYSEIMSSLGLPKEVYDKLDLWYSSMLITSLSMTNAANPGESIIPALGLDQYFLMDSSNKNVIELEGIKYQYDMMEGYSKALQVETMKSLLEPIAKGNSNDSNSNRESSIDVLNKIFDYWKSSDANKLSDLVYKDIETMKNPSLTSKEFNDKMYYNRNNEMTNKVIEMINDDNEDYFVVAGSAHMVGKTGIVQQLIDKGYTVRQIKN